MSMVSWLLALDALHVAVVRGPTPYCSAKPARACAPASPPGARRAATAGDGRKEMQYHVLPFVVEEQHGVDSVRRSRAPNCPGQARSSPARPWPHR